MNEVCCCYELSEAQLTEVNGGFLPAIAAGVGIAVGVATLTKYSYEFGKHIGSHLKS